VAKAKAKTSTRKTAKKAAPKRTAKTATKTTAKKSTTTRATKKSTTKKKVTKKAAPKKSSAKKSTEEKDAVVKVDRRTLVKKERRTEEDRRQEFDAVAEERREAPERRAKTARRRQIDPTTCERDYTNDEIEFMHALDEYKRKAGRMFPTCSEILEVVRGLNYRRLTPEEVAKLGPANPLVEGEQPDADASDEAFAESTFANNDSDDEFGSTATEQPPVFASIASHTPNDSFSEISPTSLEDFEG